MVWKYYLRSQAITATWPRPSRSRAVQIKASDAWRSAWLSGANQNRSLAAPSPIRSPCFNRTVLPWETPLMINNASEQGVAVIPFSPALSSLRCVSQTPLATIWRSQLFAWPSVKGKQRDSIELPAVMPSTLSSRIFKKAFVPRRYYHPDKRANPLLDHPEQPCSR